MAGDSASQSEAHPKTRVKWPASYRLIPSKYPPIDLFDDISPPEDWELLAQAESRTNPRILDQVGDLRRVPTNRRVSGPGASWLMAPLTHVSIDRKSRFADGTYGAYYCARRFETALRETVFHWENFLRATSEDSGWVTEMREIVAKVDHEFTDLCDHPIAEVLDKDSYLASQKWGSAQRELGADGILYPSQRHEGGLCLAVFWPDVIELPKQGSHWIYHWDGERIDYAKKLSSTDGNHKVFRL
ncbi:MAG: RES family NAD+ phosphorylase [Opitutales bacterium]